MKTLGDDMDKDILKLLSGELDKLNLCNYVPKTKNNAMESVDTGGDNKLDVAESDKDQPQDKKGQLKTGENETDKTFLSEKEPKKEMFPVFHQVPMLIESWIQNNPSNINVILASVFGISPAIQCIFKNIIPRQIIEIVTADSIKYYAHKLGLIVIIPGGRLEEPDFNLLLKYLSTLHTDTEPCEGHRSKILEAFDLRRFRVLHEQELSRLLYHRYSYQGLLNPGTQREQGDMRYEAWRLRSFEGVDIVVSPLYLVATGFYATGDGDETRCFSCGRTHRNWTSSDNPFQIHVSISPRCYHVTGTDDNNVSIQCTVPEHPADEESPIVDDTSDIPEQRTVCTTPSPQKPLSKNKYEDFLSSQNTDIYKVITKDGHDKQLDIAAKRFKCELVIKKRLHEKYHVNGVDLLEKDYNEEESEETRCLSTDSQGPVIDNYNLDVSPKQLKNNLNKPDTTDYSDSASESSTAHDVLTDTQETLTDRTYSTIYLDIHG